MFNCSINFLLQTVQSDLFICLFCQFFAACYSIHSVHSSVFSTLCCKLFNQICSIICSINSLLQTVLSDMFVYLFNQFCAANCLNKSVHSSVLSNLCCKLFCQYHSFLYSMISLLLLAVYSLTIVIASCCLRCLQLVIALSNTLPPAVIINHSAYPNIASSCAIIRCLKLY